MTTEAPPAPSPAPAPKSNRNRNIAIGCGGLVVLFLICGVIGNMMPKTTAPAGTATTAAPEAVSPDNMPTPASTEEAIAKETTVALWTEEAAMKAQATEALATLKAPPPTDPPKQMTMDTYNQIETGMTYEQVVAIAGEPKQELSSTDMGGFKTVTYQWDGNAFASNAILMFQNGQLISKSQIGLK